MIESYRVSSPSSVGWPPRSRTLSRPSQTRSRLRCNGGGGPAPERRGAGVLDLDVDECSGRVRPGEVDGRVAARATAEQCWIGAARAFDEHLLDAADAVAVPLEGDALDDVDEPLD